MAIYYYNTIIGKIGIEEENENIIAVHFGEIKDKKEIRETKLIKEASIQLFEYLEGKRKEFDLPLNPIGTDFMRNVWKALTSIPYGTTASYEDIAKKVNSPKACRAVGLANNKNPIPIFIPCHRVIGKNGKLVGYGGGLDIKEKLLDIEHIKYVK